MRTLDGYRSWAHACVAMEPSLQYRPEMRHKDGYEESRAASLEMVVKQAELYLRWRAGRATA